MKYFRRFNNENEFNEFTSKGFAPQFYIFTLKDGSKNIIYKHKMNCDFRVEHSFTDEELNNLTQYSFISELPFNTNSFKINGKECLEITEEKNYTVSPLLTYNEGNLNISEYAFKQTDYDNIYVNANPLTALFEITCEKTPTHIAVIMKENNNMNIIDISSINDWTTEELENGETITGAPLYNHPGYITKTNDNNFIIYLSLSDWGFSDDEYGSTILLGTEELFNKLQSQNENEIIQSINELNSYNTTFNISYPEGGKLNLNNITKLNNSIVEVSFNNDAVGHYQLPSTVISLIVNESFNNNSVLLQCNNKIKSLEINNYTGLVGVSSSELKSIVLGENFYYLEDYIFNGCTGLEFITCKAITPPAMSPEDEFVKNHVFDGVDKNIPIYVPKGTISSYQNAPGWKEFKNIQEID